MNNDEFVKQYYEIAGRAMAFSEKARREGLLALEEDSDQEKIDGRDIFEYGIRFVVDGTDRDMIEKILSNIIAQEKDEYQRVLKTIQKEAVLAIQSGLNPRMLASLMNSYTDLPLSDEKHREMLND